MDPGEHIAAILLSLSLTVPKWHKKVRSCCTWCYGYYTNLFHLGVITFVCALQEMIDLHCFHVFKHFMS